MGIFLVDRVSQGVTVDQLIQAQRALMEMSQRFSARGEHIRCLRSIYIAGESRCLSLFEAPDPQRLEEVFEVARISFTKIVEALEFYPEQ